MRETEGRKKSNECNQCAYASYHAGNLGKRLKIHSGEKTNKCNQCDYACPEPSHLKTRSGENKKMQPMRLCILLCKRFEETFEKTQWRKVKQMQPMQLCILWGKLLEETFENTQWGKAKQMQPVWFCKMFSPDNICIKYSYISSSQQYLCDYSTRFIFDKICWQQILLKSNQREM